MKRTIDAIFNRVRLVSEELNGMDEGDPSRPDLVRQLERLRAEAQSRANSARHPLSVEAETAMLEARLSEIDALFVSKGYAEKHLTKGFSDPGAYSATINRKIADDHAAEISEIEQRLSVLREIDLTDSGS